MKTVFKYLSIAVACGLALSCGGSVQENTQESLSQFMTASGEYSFTVGDVRFSMVPVEGGFFTMGKTPEQGGGNDPAMHPVIVDGFAIGKFEVSQALWQEVMGSNPSPEPNPKASVSRVTWKDCRKFVDGLSRKTGVRFRLPTEAEWEYAARGGNKSLRYRCSGSNDGKTRENELGIFDMSGNLWEWVEDSYADFTVTALSVNPTGPEVSANKVIRGGSAASKVGEKYVSSRQEMAQTSKSPAVGLRLAMSTGAGHDKSLEAVLSSNEVEREPSDGKAETIAVGNIRFKMLPVPAGTINMGATAEQAKWAEEDEKPVHEVTLSAFKMGQYEVTCSLWNAVMGWLPAKCEDDSTPAVNISWYDAQAFIRKLNALTGRKFRLPTEAEWEYAARGARNGGNNVYAGSEYCMNVAVYSSNSDGKVLAVGTKSPNSLGLYDMSGNAWEWCQDWYSAYSAESVTDPAGPASGELKILRGGSAPARYDACRVSNRSDMYPVNLKSTFGFRLAL